MCVKCLTAFMFPNIVHVYCIKIDVDKCISIYKLDSIL